MKKILLYIALGASLSACIYPYNPDLESNPDQTLVVDGQVLVGGISTFRLSYLIPLSGNATGVARGMAWVEDEQGNRYEQIPDNMVYYDSPGPGYGGNGYTTGSAQLSNSIRVNTANAPLGRKYRAHVECDGATYVSDWLEPDPAPTIQDISFTADDNTVTVNVSLDAGLNGSGYIGFMYDETWQFHSDFYPQYYIDTNSWTYINAMEVQFEYQYYWCYRNFSSQQITLLDYTSFEGSTITQFPLRRFPRTDSRNHKRYSINVKAFALSKAAFQFNKQMQEISEIGGDLFTPDPGAIRGNLICESDPTKEVMGLVLAGNVTSKRAFMYDDFYLRHEPRYDFVKVEKDEMPHYYYDMDFRPIQDTQTEELGQFVGWGPESCINCLLKGGYQEKPDFWED